MSRSPPRPPSPPRTVAADLEGVSVTGVNIDEVRIDSVLQGTRSEGRWSRHPQLLSGEQQPGASGAASSRTHCSSAQIQITADSRGGRGRNDALRSSSSADGLVRGTSVHRSTNSPKTKALSPRSLSATEVGAPSDVREDRLYWKGSSHIVSTQGFSSGVLPNRSLNIIGQCGVNQSREHAAITASPITVQSARSSSTPKVWFTVNVSKQPLMVASRNLNDTSGQCAPTAFTIVTKVKTKLIHSAGNRTGLVAGPTRAVTATLAQQPQKAIDDRVDDSGVIVEDAPDTALASPDNGAVIVEDAPDTALASPDNGAVIVEDAPDTALASPDNSAVIVEDAPDTALASPDNSAVIVEDAHDTALASPDNAAGVGGGSPAVHIDPCSDEGSPSYSRASAQRNSRIPSFTEISDFSPVSVDISTDDRPSLFNSPRVAKKRYLMRDVAIVLKDEDVEEPPTKKAVENVPPLSLPMKPSEPNESGTGLNIQEPSEFVSNVNSGKVQPLPEYVPRDITAERLVNYPDHVIALPFQNKLGQPQRSKKELQRQTEEGAKASATSLVLVTENRAPVHRRLNEFEEESFSFVEPLFETKSKETKQQAQVPPEQVVSKEVSKGTEKNEEQNLILVAENIRSKAHEENATIPEATGLVVRDVSKTLETCKYLEESEQKFEVPQILHQEAIEMKEPVLGEPFPEMIPKIFAEEQAVPDVMSLRVKTIPGAEKTCETTDQAVAEKDGMPRQPSTGNKMEAIVELRVSGVMVQSEKPQEPAAELVKAEETVPEATLESQNVKESAIEPKTLLRMVPESTIPEPSPYEKPPEPAAVAANLVKTASEEAISEHTTELENPSEPAAELERGVETVVAGKIPEHTVEPAQPSEPAADLVNGVETVAEETIPELSTEAEKAPVSLAEFTGEPKDLVKVISGESFSVEPRSAQKPAYEADIIEEVEEVEMVSDRSIDVATKSELQKHLYEEVMVNAKETIQQPTAKLQNANGSAKHSMAEQEITLKAIAEEVDRLEERGALQSAPEVPKKSEECANIYEEIFVLEKPTKCLPEEALPKYLKSTADDTIPQIISGTETTHNIEEYAKPIPQAFVDNEDNEDNEESLGYITRESVSTGSPEFTSWTVPYRGSQEPVKFAQGHLTSNMRGGENLPEFDTKRSAEPVVRVAGEVEQDTLNESECESANRLGRKQKYPTVENEMALHHKLKYIRLKHGKHVPKPTVVEAAFQATDFRKTHKYMPVDQPAEDMPTVNTVEDAKTPKEKILETALKDVSEHDSITESKEVPEVLAENEVKGDNVEGIEESPMYLTWIEEEEPYSEQTERAEVTVSLSEPPAKCIKAAEYAPEKAFPIEAFQESVQHGRKPERSDELQTAQTTSTWADYLTEIVREQTCSKQTTESVPEHPVHAALKKTPEFAAVPETKYEVVEEVVPVTERAAITFAQVTSLCTEQQAAPERAEETSAIFTEPQCLLQVRERETLADLIPNKDTVQETTSEDQTASQAGLDAEKTSPLVVKPRETPDVEWGAEGAEVERKTNSFEKTQFQQLFDAESATIPVVEMETLLECSPGEANAPDTNNESSNMPATSNDTIQALNVEKIELKPKETSGHKACWWCFTFGAGSHILEDSGLPYGSQRHVTEDFTAAEFPAGTSIIEADDHLSTVVKRPKHPAKLQTLTEHNVDVQHSHDEASQESSRKIKESEDATNSANEPLAACRGTEKETCIETTTDTTLEALCLDNVKTEIEPEVEAVEIFHEERIGPKDNEEVKKIPEFSTEGKIFQDTPREVTGAFEVKLQAEAEQHASTIIDMTPEIVPEVNATENIFKETGNVPEDSPVSEAVPEVLEPAQDLPRSIPGFGAFYKSEIPERSADAGKTSQDALQSETYQELFQAASVPVFEKDTSTEDGNVIDSSREIKADMMDFVKTKSSYEPIAEAENVPNISVRSYSPAEHIQKEGYPCEESVRVQIKSDTAFESEMAADTLTARMVSQGFVDTATLPDTIIEKEELPSHEDSTESNDALQVFSSYSHRPRDVVEVEPTKGETIQPPKVMTEAFAAYETSGTSRTGESPPVFEKMPPFFVKPAAVRKADATEIQGVVTEADDIPSAPRKVETPLKPSENAQEMSKELQILPDKISRACLPIYVPEENENARQLIAKPEPVNEPAEATEDELEKINVYLLKPGGGMYNPDYDWSLGGRKFKPHSQNAGKEEASSCSRVDGDEKTLTPSSRTGRPGEDFKATPSPSMVQQDVSSVTQDYVRSKKKYNKLDTETTKDLSAGNKKGPKGTRKGAGKKRELTRRTSGDRQEGFRAPYPTDKSEPESRVTDEFQKSDEVRMSSLSATFEDREPRPPKDSKASEPSRASLSKQGENFVVFGPGASENSEEGTLISTSETSVYKRVKETKKVPSWQNILRETTILEPAPPTLESSIRHFFFSVGKNTGPESKSIAAEHVLVDTRETVCFTNAKTVTTLSDAQNQQKRIFKNISHEAINMTERDSTTPNVVLVKASSSYSYLTIEDSSNIEDEVVAPFPSHATTQGVKYEAKAPITYCVFKTSFQRSENTEASALVEGAGLSLNTAAPPATVTMQSGKDVYTTSVTDNIATSSEVKTSLVSLKNEQSVASGSSDIPFGAKAPSYSEGVSGDDSPSSRNGLDSSSTLIPPFSSGADETPDREGSSGRTQTLSPNKPPSVICKWCGETYCRTNPSHALVCFGYHDDATPMASVPENLDSKYDLHVVDEDDVAAVLAKAWSDDRTAVVTPALWTFYRCSPNGFYVVRERRKSTQGGEICAAAAVVTFEDETSFCPFFHLSQERAGYGISRLLWNQILHYCTGKNIVTVMSHEVAAAFLRRYRFNVSSTGDIMYGLVKVHSRSFAGSANVRDYQKDRDFRALVDYDRSVFGFGRRHYLTFALAEAEQMVKIATTIGGEICGYVGVQRDQRGCPLLRWLLANDAPTAEGLLHDVVSSCELVQERGLVAAFYTASPVTKVILNKVDDSLLEPWVLIYSRREPFCRVDRIVSLTFI